MSQMTGAGTAFFVGPVLTANLPSTPDAAITLLKGITYVEIGEVENLGDHGDERSDVSFTALKAARVSHHKGAADAGTMALPVALDNSDAGQIAMVAAFKSNSRFNYPFKVIYPDGETDYFVGKVMSIKKTNVQNSDVLRRNFSIGINSEIFEVMPTS